MPSWIQPVSPVVVGATGVLLLAALGWTLIWVPTHRANRRIKAIAQQAASVVLSIVLSLALVFLVLNMKSLWYATWSSMRGTGAITETDSAGAQLDPDQPANGWQTGTPTSLQADPRANPAFGDQDWSTTTSGGHYLTVSIPGTASGQAESAGVWLPSSYLDHPERFYPVLVGFSGVPGSIQAMFDGIHPDQALVSGNTNHQVREAIIVIPDAYPDNLDTECVDATDGSVKMETFITSDVVNWITANLRADPDHSAWATFGYSAGGFCSTMITMRNPDKFAASINLSGYFTADFEGPKLRPDGDTTYDMAVLAQAAPPDVDLWFLTAKDDPMPYQAWQQFNPLVTAPTSLTSQLVDTGGHTNPVWIPGLVAAFAWLGQTQPRFGWVTP